MQRTIFDIQDMRERLQAIFEYAVNGDPICRRITDEVVDALVKSIVLTTYIINPDMIVIGGILSAAPVEIYQQIESTVYDALPVLFTNYLLIRQAVMSQPNRAAIGAGHHFLQTYLSDIATDPLTIAVQ
jgi:predicted NBD/HSP70 family sugar kinase